VILYDWSALLTDIFAHLSQFCDGFCARIGATMPTLVSSARSIAVRAKASKLIHTDCESASPMTAQPGGFGTAVGRARNARARRRSTRKTRMMEV
jgi:hypothetical protein